MSAWAPNTPLGPYILLAPIGAGGMGEVWKARDTRLDRIVAIKRLKINHTARFEQEARAIAALNHPHICQIHDIGPDYLVLEYIEGKPLHGPLPPNEAVRLALQVAAALEEAHARGILHRDLKPANIMVTAKGSAKLLDFGLAKLSADAEATQTMAVMGTPAYMAPEQAEGKPLDQRSDIFSFGAVLYEILSGRRPFDTLAAVLRDDPKPLDAPSALSEVVMRCLSKSPAGRFQTMSDVAQAFLPVLLLPAPSQPSIAVLPFANMSGDKEQEYFSDGLAEEIINALAQIPGLKVIARTSAFAFRGKELDIRKIAEALGVATVLEGSVRRAGNRVRITAQLITAADGSHLWSQRYDREMEDVFAVQDELAATIAGVLQVKLAQPGREAPPAAARHRTPRLDAYEAYLKARHYQWKITPETLARAGDYYRQAIELDPDFALAYVGLADHFLIQTVIGGNARQLMRQTREAAQKAAGLDPSLPEANAMLGIVAGTVADYDWNESERCFRLAMAHHSVPPQVLVWHAYFSLLPMGRLIESIDEFQLALQQDPLNVQFRFLQGFCLLAAGEFARVEQASREVLEIDPHFYGAYMFLCFAALKRGAVTEARDLGKKMWSQAPFSRAGTGLYAGLLVRAGDTQQAQAILPKFSEEPQYPGRLHYYLGCGDTDGAVEAFERMIGQGATVIGMFHIAQAFCPSPRWAAFAKKLNLPAGSVLR